MTGKKAIVLAASVGLVLVLLLTGCPAPTSPTPSASSTPTPTPTATVSPTATPSPTSAVGVDLTYNVLSPRGIQPAIQINPLAPRLETFDGKVIWVNQGEADPVIMPAVWDRVQKEFPKATWKLIASSSFGPSNPEAEVLDVADAVIRGIGW